MEATAAIAVGGVAREVVVGATMEMVMVVMVGAVWVVAKAVGMVEVKVAATEEAAGVMEAPSAERGSECRSHRSRFPVGTLRHCRP